MFDSIPPQAWIVLVLAIIATGRVIYLWRHLVSIFQKRDITQPPDDLSWRSSKQFYASLTVVMGLLAVGVFIFTPYAEQFAKSDFFVPSLLGSFGSAALVMAVRGFQTGQAEPLVRGARMYVRDEQPIRYWLSLGWNAIMGTGLLAMSIFAFGDVRIGKCDEDRENLKQALMDCNTMLAKTDLNVDRKADLLGARGRVLHKLERPRAALADYSAALTLDPGDSYALYNRGLVFDRIGKPRQAIADYTASLAIRPDNQEAYQNRARAYLLTGQVAKAFADLSTVARGDRGSAIAMASAMTMYVWHNELALLERNVEPGAATPEAKSFVLRGRAMLAMEQKDPLAAIALLTDALESNPEDYAALRQRSDAYWQAGQMGLSRADDSRATELELRGKDFPPYVAFDFP